MTKKSEISRRKALAMIAGTGAAATVGGAGTYAYITDGNTTKVSFQSGSIILKISPKVIDFTSESTSDGEDNQQDDGSEMKTTIKVTNAGTLPAGQLQLTGLTLSGPEDLKKAAEITSVGIKHPGESSVIDELSTWSGVITGAGHDSDGDGKDDLIDLKNKFDTGEVISLLGNSYTLKAFEENAMEITIGITYDYSQVTTDSGTLEADFQWRAKQKR